MGFPLDRHGEQDLRELVTDLEGHEGAWYEIRGGGPDARGVTQLRYYAWHPIVSRAYQFIYDRDIDFVFDWSSWEEGRELFTSERPNKYAALDDVTIRKLLTAVVRGERFAEGTWLTACERGDVTLLLRRLLELQESARQAPPRPAP